MKRKNEKWVSNNRVLLGSSKKDPGRNPNFDTEETKLLISLWGDPNVQKTLITTHRKHTVIAKLAEKMNEYGYSRSTEEINTRIKNLKCFYNRLKKDVEAGTINGITWKHFAAMDEIMTRSIFSVRPNEIPKPSLKYQMEQELEEKRKKLRSEPSLINGNELSNNGYLLLDENISSSSLISRDDNEQSDESMDFIEKPTSLSKVKEEDCLNTIRNDREGSPLIIAKEEPIDYDDDLQFLSNKTNDNSINDAIENDFHKVHPTTETFSITPSPVITTQSSTVLSQSIVLTNPTNHQISAAPQGKISLVPTNFLLQQNKKPQSQPQQIQIRPQVQQRLICATPNSKSNQTGIVSSTNSGTMKVLLVNAFQNGSTSNISTSSNDCTQINPNLISAPNNHQSETSFPLNFNEQQRKDRADDTEVNAKEYGLEFLMNKLIDAQNENNEIQRQRLELNKERFDFEKIMTNRILEAITSLSQLPTKENDTMSKAKSDNTSSKDTNSKMSIVSEVIQELNNHQLLTPKIEEID